MIDKENEVLRTGLRQVREKLNLSIKAFAKKLEIKEYTIADMERGKTRVSAEVLRKVALTFGVATDVLLGVATLNATSATPVTSSAAVATGVAEEVAGYDKVAQRLARVAQQLNADEQQLLFSATQEFVQFKTFKQDIKEEIAALRKEIAALRNNKSKS